jgi:hypothetical protein
MEIGERGNSLVFFDQYGMNFDVCGYREDNINISRINATPLHIKVETRRQKSPGNTYRLDQNLLYILYLPAEFVFFSFFKTWGIPSGNKSTGYLP